MFLFQKLKYKYKHIKNAEDFENFVEQFERDAPSIIVFDTETTGLNIITDKPFIIGVTWDGHSYSFETTEDNKWMMINIIEMMRRVEFAFAHNTKFDYHMIYNYGTPIKNVPLADGMTVARLTNYADDPSNIGLEALGTRYVDPDAKSAGKAIREIINRINKERLKHVKSILKEQLPKGIKMMDVIDAWRKRVQFVENEYDEYFKIIDENYSEPTYYDAYLDNPNLMLYYMIDDTVILLEYLKKALPILEKINEGYGGVFQQECDLIIPVATMERNGLPVDVDYLLSSRKLVLQYIEQTYDNLWNLTGDKEVNGIYYKFFTSGQHKVIMDMFKNKYDITMLNCDMKALNEIANSNVQPNAILVANYIIELRTLDKWLSTYIEGMLNRVIIDDDFIPRIHTSINNSGAVTGRVSSDMQQQPKEPLLTRDGKELFHPRKVFINEANAKTYYYDFSQMELRLQANHTVEVSGGDKNLCRAFIPFDCRSVISGDKYDMVIDYNDWDSGEWVDENGDVWNPVDLHSITTLKAFPFLTLDHPDFQHYRKYGKIANFLKIYSGGVDAIKQQLNVSDEIAQALNKAYYDAFPKILDYQKDIDNKLSTYGFIENIYGRKYYIQNREKFYKAYNYEIQGGCADLVKEKQIKVHNFLEEHNLKSKLILVVHDELIMMIYDDEEWIVPEIKKILDDNKDRIKYIPMLCDVEVTHTNWAEKE